jgi:2-polyprenyl-3-methyl-5-hydroxy-6-metoxy-1,4-benzoquinol methylase
MSSSHDYPLGYSEQEAKRLAAQGELLEEFTRDMLRRAGLQPGMRVLDLGSGVGDVSILAARLVGSGGSVLGVERAAASVQTARQRAAALGIAHVHFAEADLASVEPDGKFDALIGRLILLYLPDPAKVLRRLMRYLVPGAIVAFQEFDMSQVAQTPPSELFTRARGWILEAFAAAGAEVDMGSRLHPTFLRAGLSAPSMTAATHVLAGPSVTGFDYMVQVIRSLLPLIERSGIASAAEVGIDTLSARLRDDAVAQERTTFMPRVVSAWTRMSGPARS